jgi:hypothetical protein
VTEHHHSGPLSAWLNTTDLDHNGRPYKITVSLSDERHLTEDDAEWLRAVIRAAGR